MFQGIFTMYAGLKMRAQKDLRNIQVRTSHDHLA